MEGVQVDPRRDDDDLLGAGAVVPLQLGGLVGGVGGQRVGARRRWPPRRARGRRARPAGPCPSAAFLTRAMVCMVCTSGMPWRGSQLDARPCPTASSGSGSGRSPVIAASSCEPKACTSPGRASLATGSGGPAGTLITRVCSFTSTIVGGRARFGPGEHVDLEPALAEPPGHLGDVHVEPAGVTDPGRGQRRGVHADHRHPVWIGHRTGHAGSSLMSRPAAAPPGPAPGRRSAGIVRVRGR